MCDTLVGLAPATATGGTIFGKNSDRERNEAQGLEFVPAARHAPGAPLKLTYIEIPQVASTHGCLISRPFWMWGAEMGANAHGVVIGNEAVFAKVPAARRRSLIGMDLVRLGVERGASAAEALEVMIALLERHGQGGDCGHLARFYYHNSFIIADARQAFVLETVGRWWVVEEVKGGLRALSNALSIGRAADRVSPALAAHAAAEGWTDADGRFDFAGRLLDEDRDAISRGRMRCARGQTLLERRREALDALAMMAILRDHGEGAEGAGAAGGAAWHPAHTVGRSICMHAAEGPRRSQSVGSLVSDMTADRAVHWVTGTSAPCLSLFKPFVFDAALPAQGPAPSDRFDARTLWWRHEQAHRAALGDYAARLAELAPERDRLETAFMARMDEALGAGGAAVQAAIDACWAEAEAAETRWRAAAGRGSGKAPAPFARSWARLNQAAGFERG